MPTNTGNNPAGAQGSNPTDPGSSSGGSHVATTTDQGSFVDPVLSSQFVNSLSSLLQNATSPDALEAQSIVLRRMALEGDVVPSRIQPPRNISEIGGYINLLTTLEQPEMRTQALAGILGVAGPVRQMEWVSNDQPLAFVNLSNDRPAGPGQPTFPLTISVRSDFSSALQAAIKSLHDRGCTLPLVSGPTSLPVATPGVQTTLDPLPFLGRVINIAAKAALLDPTTDPVALVRTQGSSNPFQIASNVINSGSVAVTPANYDALQCTPTTCTTVQITGGVFVPVAPILANAGFYPASPLPQPANSAANAWTKFTNITGLVQGVTRLGDELSLVYNWSAVNHSVFGGMLNWVWNGKQFASS